MEEEQEEKEHKEERQKEEEEAKERSEIINLTLGVDEEEPHHSNPHEEGAKEVLEGRASFTAVEEEDTDHP